MRETRGITLLGCTWALPPLPSVKSNVKVTTFRLVIMAVLKWAPGNNGCLEVGAGQFLFSN